METEGLARVAVAPGATAAEVVANVVARHSRIAKIFLSTIDVSHAGSLTPKPDVKKFDEEALELRAQFNVPFWMAIVLTAESRHELLPKAVFEAAGFHRSMGDAVKSIVPVDMLGRELLRHAEDARPLGKIVTISSKVELQFQQYAHIPMLDFRSRSGATGFAHVQQVVQHLGQPGAILDSGKSYHFYGYELLEEQDFRAFLGRALLYTPIVDHRWIAHQLIEGACALRISPTKKTGSSPKFVATVA
jgi:hypothetical protein